MTHDVAKSLPEHLDARFATPEPRKLLALHGGGIRGMLTLELLSGD